MYILLQASPKLTYVRCIPYLISMRFIKSISSRHGCVNKRSQHKLPEPTVGA